jgi:hypothetical protein
MYFFFLNNQGRILWVVREGMGEGGEMTQELYAHMNNKKKSKEKKR